eukprot:1565203-Pleurochrysis_carterae.AAC.2
MFCTSVMLWLRYLGAAKPRDAAPQTERKKASRRWEEGGLLRKGAVSNASNSAGDFVQSSHARPMRGCCVSRHPRFHGNYA